MALHMCVLGFFLLSLAVIDNANGRDEAVGVRLVSSTGLTRGMGGRVEVFYLGQWYTVQDRTTIGISEANVICKQLGFRSVFHYGRSSELGYTEHSSRDSFSALSCFGFESRASDCFFIFTNVGTSNSWAVSCAGTVSPPSPEDGDIRLSTEGTSRPFSGRLEVYYNRQWGTVCDDSFSQTEADVACRQLGLVGALYYGNVGEIGFGEGSGPILLDDLNCSSSDIELSQCTTQTIGSHNCGHRQDVALVCYGEGSVRVTSDSSGTTSATLTSGRLEVFAGGRWGTVCDDSFGQTEADLACRGIGQGRAESFNNVGFSRAFNTSLPILLDDVSCGGSEANLLLCSHGDIATDDCTHSEDIRISCSPLSTAAVIAIAVVVPLVVIIILCCVCCCICCCCCCNEESSDPNVPAVTRTSYTTIKEPENESQETGYPLQPTAYPDQEQSGEDHKPELHPDPPLAYGEAVNYPEQYPAQDTGDAVPQPPPPQP